MVLCLKSLSIRKANRESIAWPLVRREGAHRVDRVAKFELKGTPFGSKLLPLLFLPRSSFQIFGGTRTQQNSSKTQSTRSNPAGISPRHLSNVVSSITVLNMIDDNSLERREGVSYQELQSSLQSKAKCRTCPLVTRTAVKAHREEDCTCS